MSFIALKKFIWPSSSTAGYAPLARERHSDPDVEKGERPRRPSRAPITDDDQKNARSTLFLSRRTISDVIIGLSDGLTVPFALTAGLSALGATEVVVVGGLAELVAGSISMGLGGYLGAKSEEESHMATVAATTRRVRADPAAALDAAAAVLAPFGFPDDLQAATVRHLAASDRLPAVLAGADASDNAYFASADCENINNNSNGCSSSALPPPPPSRALTAALTIAAGYFAGGFVPLLPYFFATTIGVARGWSVAVMAVALFAFGFGKTVAVQVDDQDGDYGPDDSSRTCFTGGRWQQASAQGIAGGMQMVVVGGVAAGCAMGLVIGSQVWLGDSEGGS